jgi:molecular chaperone DnaK
MGKTIGIDLGTTNSCVAVIDGATARIIPNNLGGRTTPSIVAFADKGERIIGQIAKRQAVANAANTIYAVKRFMGRQFDTPEIQQVQTFLPYTIKPSENGDVRVTAAGRDYSPPEISAMILQYLKSAAEDFLNEPVTEAIITVPAYFDDSQRQATKDAGQIAGLQVQRIINEPTAAALAYGLGKRTREKIVVFDLGGGTFDISILELNDGVFEVISTCGDSFLGGEDFDRCIVDWMIDEFKTEYDIDLGQDIIARQRIKEAAEKAKCELSLVEESRISLPFIASDESGPKHFDKALTRDHFEFLVQDLVSRTTKFCEQALEDARMTPDDVDKVILVGGQTRTPAIQRHVAQIFGKQPSLEANPDEVVAIGAALQGGVLEGSLKDIVLLDVLPLSLGVETHGGLFTRLIDRNSTIPLKKTAIFTTVADNQTVVEIHVLQGERDVARFNRSLAKFDLVGILPAPSGVPQVEVSFDMDANGILSVSAKDKVSGNKQNIRITPSTGLSKDEIDKMTAEAKNFAVNDQKVKKATELRNRVQAQTAVLVRSYAGFGSFLDHQDKEKIQNLIQEANELDPNEEDTNVLDNMMLQIEEGASIMSKTIFNAPGNTSGAATGGGSKKG